MSVEREGTFYPVWPNIDGKNLNMQWGEIRSNTAETKAIVRNSVQDLEDGVDELNALRALLGQEYGDLDFRNKFRFFYNKTTFELCCQKNDGTVDVPVWIDAWCVRFTDGQFQAVGTGGIQSDAGFYGQGLSSIGEVGETGSAADNTVLNPTKIFFNTDDGLEVETISSGANAGAPEIRFTQPFGRAETFSKVGSEWTVAHNFDASPVLVQLYDDDDRVIFPDKADVSDPNTAYFYFHAATTGKVTIATGGTGAASLVPRDPFYIVIRSDGQPAAEHTLEPNADLIFDSTQFYVDVDLDTDTGGSHKKAFVSIHTTPSGSVDHGGLQGLADDDHAQYARTDGTRDITGHQRFDDTINVENAVTAEAFYVTNTAELSEAGVRTPDGSASVVPHSFTSAPNSGMLLDGSGDVELIRAGQVKVSASTANVAILNGYLEVASNPIRGNEGDAGGPGYTFDLDTDTGMFGAAANTLGFSTGGIERARLAADGLNVVDKVKAEAFYVAGSSNEINDTQFLGEDGSLSAPSFAFTSTPNTGVFIDGSGHLNLVRDGAVKLLIRSSDTISSTNAIVVGNGNVSTPSFRSTGSSDTGIFFEGETFSITANGSRVANFGQDGMVVDGKAKAEAFYVTSSSNQITDAQFLGEDGPSSAPTFSYTSQPTSGWGLSSSNPTLYKLGSSKIAVSTSSISIQNASLRVPNNNAHFANGSAASPSISFDDYQDLGIYAPADHTLGFSAQGINRATLSADGLNVTDKVVAEAFYVASGGEMSEQGVLVPDGLSSAPSISFQSSPSSGMFIESDNMTFVKLGATKMTLRTSDVLFNNQLNLANGSASAPSTRFAGAATTGIFRSSPDHLGITVDGDQAAIFGPDGLGVDKWVTAEAFYWRSGGDIAETWVSFDIAGAAVDNYFINTAGADFQVIDASVITSTGSATIGFYIHTDGETTPGIGIPGLDPIAASTTRATATASVPLVVLDGEELVMSVPANSFATHLRGRVKIRRIN